jgi:hypothetical protein
VKDELKYLDVRDALPRLEGDQGLWRSIRSGVGQATVVVIDPKPFANDVESSFRAEHAEPGVDYTEHDVLDCATAIVARTPIAYLPERLNSEVRWSHCESITALESFAPEDIRKRLGGGLRDEQHARCTFLSASEGSSPRTFGHQEFSTRSIRKAQVC